MLSGEHQLFAILDIISETMGKSRRKGSVAPEWSRPLSHAVMARKCGCSKDRIAADLADAERRKLITSLTPEQAAKLGLKQEGSPLAKRYKVLPKNWAGAKPYQPPKIAIVRSLPKRAEVEDFDEDEDDHCGDGTVATACAIARSDRAERVGPAAAAPPRHVTITVKPGQEVRPQLGLANAYRFQAFLSFPVELDARNEKGVINFLIRESNQRVTDATDERSSVGHKSSRSDRRARLVAELADRQLPITPAFAVSLEGKLGTCDLDFFLRRLDQRRKRSSKFTSALLPDICVEAAQEWKAAEPVERRFADEIAKADRRAAEVNAERQAYWDSPEGRARADQFELEYEEGRKREAARQARIAACTQCKGKGTVTITYRRNPGSIDTTKRDVPCECAKEE